MNPIFKLLQSLPTNGWTTAIGGVALFLFGGGSFVVSMINPEAASSVCSAGVVDPEVSIGLMFAGLTALGIGNKMEKMNSPK